jgi:hypothetical protein
VTVTTSAFTTRGQLALHGASGGGLHVGAVMTQRPDLAAVAVPMVGVMDMLLAFAAEHTGLTPGAGHGLPPGDRGIRSAKNRGGGEPAAGNVNWHRNHNTHGMFLKKFQ